MKKNLSVVLSIVLLVSVVLCVFTGCGKEPEYINEPEVTTGTLPSQPVMSGGWQLETEFEAPAIPDNAKSAFERATAELDGVQHEAIAYLGSQVVAGMNYAFLCKTSAVTSEPNVSLNVVTVYNDLDNFASVTESVPVDITAYTAGDTDIDFALLDGGWSGADAVGGKLKVPVKTAFDKAMTEMTGVTYEPIATLGSQLVAGNNYAVLCKATPATGEPVTKLAVVIIYADLAGNAQVTSISGFDF